MPKLVVMGAVTQCSFGTAPSVLNVLPVKRINAPTPAANIMDHVPVTNIVPFTLCTSLGNPAVQEATKAAGVLCPMPCTPVTPAPWVPGAMTVLLAGAPALDDISKCMCTYGGVISIVFPGQVQTSVP